MPKLKKQSPGKRSYDMVIEITDSEGSKRISNHVEYAENKIDAAFFAGLQYARKFPKEYGWTYKVLSALLAE